MRDESKVVEYFKKSGKWAIQFEDEADLLALTTEFLYMLPETAFIRTATTVLGGTSDIIVCHKGDFVTLELKDNKGNTARLQDIFLEKIVAAGGRGAKCKTLEEVYEVLKMSR